MLTKSGTTGSTCLRASSKYACMSNWMLRSMCTGFMYPFVSNLVWSSSLSELMSLSQNVRYIIVTGCVSPKTVPRRLPNNPKAFSNSKQVNGKDRKDFFLMVSKSAYSSMLSWPRSRLCSRDNSKFAARCAADPSATANGDSPVS